MGASFQSQQGRKHATVTYGSGKARWPNPHDDPIDDGLLKLIFDDGLLKLILRQLGISRDDFFSHYK